MSMSVMEFCIRHGACSAGQAWALSTGEPDMDSLWQRDDIKSEWRIWIASQPDVLSDRERRLFVCWCCRQVWHLLTDERSRQAVEVAERYADGQASSDELAAAYDAAMDVWTAALDSGCNVAMAAARAAAWTAAYYDVCDAAWAAARTAARAAMVAGTATGAAAMAAAYDAQAAYLKEHTHPNFC